MSNAWKAEGTTASHIPPCPTSRCSSPVRKRSQDYTHPIRALRKVHIPKSRSIESFVHPSTLLCLKKCGGRQEIRNVIDISLLDSFDVSLSGKHCASSVYQFAMIWPMRSPLLVMGRYPALPSSHTIHSQRLKPVGRIFQKSLL